MVLELLNCRIGASGCRGSFSALYLKLCYCYCPTFAGHMGQGLAIGQKIISTGHELEISSWGVDPISNRGGGKENSVLLLLTRMAFLEFVESGLSQLSSKVPAV